LSAQQAAIGRQSFTFAGGDQAISLWLAMQVKVEIGGLIGSAEVEVAGDIGVSTQLVKRLATNATHNQHQFGSTQVEADT
jgi:hypothetical protein